MAKITPSIFLNGTPEVGAFDITLPMRAPSVFGFLTGQTDVDFSVGFIFVDIYQILFVHPNYLRL